jgi:YesN/AraC family two-component response regulator
MVGLRFHLVLTDVIMPDKEGLETIRELRRHDPTIKIIAMSGGGLSDPKGYLSVARKMGVSATLQKPFSYKEMMETLTQVLSPSDGPPEVVEAWV